MAKQNDAESTAGMLILTGLMIAAMLLLFLAAMLSFFLTILCLFAWNKDLHLFGHTITSSEARGFIIAGAIGALAFALLGAVLYANGTLLEENVPWMPVLGYVFGSMSIAWVYADYQERQEKAEAEARQLRQITQRYAEPVRVDQRRDGQHTFDFASWDDEEPRN